MRNLKFEFSYLFYIDGNYIYFNIISKINPIITIKLVSYLVKIKVLKKGKYRPGKISIKSMKHFIRYV